MRWALPERWLPASWFMDGGSFVEENAPEEFFANPKNERLKNVPEQGAVEKDTK